MNSSGIVTNILKQPRFKGFKFRKHQREIIEEILDYYIKFPKGNIIFSGPTGTGKSIISMFISACLNELNKNGYIITSDLSLQTQYEQDFWNYQFSWGSIRGIDNYMCTRNGEKHSLGDCRVRKLPKKSITQLDCYEQCPYFSSRDLAIESKTSLLNYSYWLIQRNYTSRLQKEKGELELFGKRDFTIFDESHKIFDIVQSHFSPRITYKILENTEIMEKFCNFGGSKINISSKEIKNLIDEIFKNDDVEILFDTLKILEQSLEEYSKKQKFIYDYTLNNYPLDTKIPDEHIQILRAADYIKDIHCKIEDYVDIMWKPQHIVKTETTNEVLLNNLNERGMIKKFLIQQANFKIFMSATIGNEEIYASNMGIDEYKFIEGGNYFDYTKSPIFFVTGYKLNYKNIDKNFNNVLKNLDKILESHDDEKGIIHTANYSLTNKIIEKSKHADRLLSYENSKEKDFIIEEFKYSKNKILIGPSLLEGLSLDDDLSRFQIFFKIPFPNLSNKFIKLELKYNPSKYNWRTTNSIIQGCGRSIRSENDWAITYILDDCFNNIIKSNTLDKIFLNRLQYIKGKINYDK